MSTCPTSSYSLPESAQLYSTLAGVLAGFAFLALIFILTERLRRNDVMTEQDERKSQENHLAISLVSAFLSLIVTAFLYGSLSSENGNALFGGRASSEELLAGVAFVVSIVTLLYALMLLISISRLPVSGDEARAIVALFVPAVAMTFLAGAAEDLAFTNILWAVHKTGTCSSAEEFYHEVNRWGQWLLPGVVLLGCVAMFALSRTKLRGWRMRRSGSGFRNLLPKGSLSVVLVAAVWTNSFSQDDPTSRLNSLEVWGFLGFSAAFLLLAAAFLLWANPGPDEDAPRDKVSIQLKTSDTTFRYESS